MMAASSEESWVRRLLDVGQALVTGFDHDALLDKVLEAAREITGDARAGSRRAAF